MTEVLDYLESFKTSLTSQDPSMPGSGGCGSIFTCGSGLALAILLIPNALSGALLVWHDHLERLAIRAATR